MPGAAIHCLYFSPLYHTREITRLIGKTLAETCGFSEPAEHDATPAGARPQITLGRDCVAIIGAPVYGGRVPQTARERFARFHGENTPAILLASYGNRAYEDALLELKDLSAANGFLPVAAAVCVAEHTILPQCANGRPDDADKESLRKFARSLRPLLEQLKTRAPGKLEVPGNFPYKEFKKSPLPQSVGSNCVQCGLCAAECPGAAIDPENAANVDQEKCFCCMRCVYICPQKARQPAPAFMEAIRQRLAPFCEIRKENEFFRAAAG